MIRFNFFSPVLIFILSLCPISSFAQTQKIETVKPKIMAVIPHDETAFTQGLLYQNGFLFESTGMYGASSFRKVSASNGQILKQINLESKYFGEGLAWTPQGFYLLTWKSGILFQVDTAKNKFNIVTRYKGEGWGLSSQHKNLLMSNGSDTLYFLGPDFKVFKKISVRLGQKPVSRLNEIEWVGDFIFANLWYETEILRIDARSGRVVQILDCSELVRMEKPKNLDCVLNGIAYREDKNTLVLTGKYWRHYYEVGMPPLASSPASRP